MGKLVVPQETILSLENDAKTVLRFLENKQRMGF